MDAARGLACSAHTSSAHQATPSASTNCGMPEEEGAARSALSVHARLSRGAAPPADAGAADRVVAVWVQRACVPQKVPSLRRRVHCLPLPRKATHRSSVGGGARGAGAGAREYVSTKVRVFASASS